MSHKLNDETLIQLLELASTEERFYIEAHQKRIQFFVVLNSTVFAGCIVGLSRAAETDIGPLILAPLLIIVSSQFGKIGVKSLYIRLLETIVQRAKLEQALGMDKPLNLDEPTGYWSREPLVNTRSMVSRNEYDTSQRFIDEKSKIGFQKTVVHIFNLFQLIGILLIVAIGYFSPILSAFFSRGI